MAVLKGLIRKMRGSAGDFTFSQNQGRTIVSEKISATTNRRTSAQQHVRMRWANIIQMYKGIMPLLDCAFENKAEGVSDYNMFVKINMQHQAVYLSKSQVSGGSCIVAPYTITQGSLQSIVVANDVTDIALGSLTIDASTTVAQFANAVVANNPDYNYGDQISFYDVEQKVNAATGMPYGVFNGYCVVLNKNSTALLLGQVPSDGFSVSNGFLAHATVTGNRAFAWVHSRRNNGKTKVSSQTLIVHNTILANYTSDSAYQTAVNSYGGERKVFLTPATIDDIASNGNGSDSGSGSPAMKTLTLTVSPSGAGTVTGTGQYAQGTNATIKATAANGYVFSKWSDNDTNATRNVTVNSDMSLVAMFTANGSEGGGNEQGGEGGDEM